MQNSGGSILTHELKVRRQGTRKEMTIHQTASDALQLPFDVDEGRISILMPEYPRYASRLKIKSVNERSKAGPYNGGIFSVPLSHDEAIEIKDALSRLPLGEAVRCFMPGYTVELMSYADEVRKVALCWNCNAMQIVGSDGKMHNFNFDGASESASQLLSRIRQLVEWHLDSEIAAQVRAKTIAGES